MREIQKENKVKYTNTTNKTVVLGNVQLKGITQLDGESDYDFIQRVIKHTNKNFIENCK